MLLRVMAAFMVGLATALVGSGPADAGDDSGSAYRYKGAGDSWQYVYWDRPSRKMRMRIFADDGMSTDRCIDVTVDWRVEDGSHYDQRVLRNCDPGGYVDTDPGGDGYWREPSNWDTDTHDSPVVGVRTVAVYKIDDDDRSIVGNPAIVQGSSNIYGGRLPPSTFNDGWAEVRTRYQSGTIRSTRNDYKPERCWQEDDSWGNDCAGFG